MNLKKSNSSLCLKRFASKCAIFVVRAGTKEKEKEIDTKLILFKKISSLCSKP